MSAPSALARGLLAAALVALPACSLGPEPAPRPLSGPALRTPSAAAAGAVLPGSRPTTLYLVRERALAPVTRRSSTAGSPRAALRLLLRGPTAAEGLQGLGSALGPEAVLVAEVVQDGDVAVVPLSVTAAEGLARSDEVLAYAQVVATLTALPGVRAVSFTREGEPLPVPRADGELVERPLTRADYASLL